MRASLVVQLVKIPSAMQETWVPFLVRKIPWRRKWQPTSGFSPGQSHGQRSLVGCSPWACKEANTPERLKNKGPRRERVLLVSY